MITPRIVLVAAFVVGCASTPRATSAPPAAQVAAVDADAATAVSPAVDTRPAADPCAEGPAHDALAGLEADHVLVDTRVGGTRRANERVIDLSPLFPTVRNDGNEVLAVTPSDVLPGGALVALVSPVGAVIQRGQQVTGPALGVLTCRAGTGWTLAARPFSLGSDALVQIISARPTPLPGGGPGVTVTVVSHLATAEWHETPYLLGSSTPELPVQFPRTATVGVLAVVGNAGERVVAEGTTEYRSITPFDATGWYPLRDEQVFLRVARERVPAANETWTDTVHAVSLARLGPRGFTDATGGNATAVWLIMGPGEMPAWCANARGLRCGRLTVDDAAITDGTIPYTWVAGAWPVGREVPRNLTAPGARWFYAGLWEGPHPPRDPSGQAPLTVVPVQPNTPVPPPRRVRR